MQCCAPGEEPDAGRGLGADEGLPSVSQPDANLEPALVSLVAPLVSDARVAAAVAACRDTAPGPDLAAVLAGVEVARLATADRLEVATAWQKLANWVAAQHLLAVASVAGPLDGGVTALGPGYSATGNEADDVVCAEIGTALCLGVHAAAAMVQRAHAAATHLAPITGRMLAGDFSEAHLIRAVDLCADAAPGVARAAAQAVAEKAPRCTPTSFRGRLHRALVKRDPGVITRRSRAARRDRGVALWADPNLRGRLDVHAEWVAVTRAHHQLSDIAHQRKNQLRQLRHNHPHVALCCPNAITTALTAAATLTSTTTSTTGQGASGTSHGQGTHTADAGDAGGAGVWSPITLTGTMTPTQARAILAGHGPSNGNGNGDGDAAGDAAGGGAGVGCRWCDATESALPTIDQLRADALIDAIEQLATTSSANTSANAASAGPGTTGAATSECATTTAPGTAPTTQGGGNPGDASGADADRATPPAATSAGGGDGPGGGDHPTGAADPDGTAADPDGIPVLGPRRGRRWSHAVVIVDLKTALGLTDEPGWIPGYGPVPGAIARELAGAATVWQRFLLDDDHTLISTGRYTYRPSQRLRELVTARDYTCTFPGCTRPANTADLDHRVNYDGTNTTAENLHPLCRTHHRLKTHHGWTITRSTTTGEDTWTSPLGRTYTQHNTPPWTTEQPDPPDHHDNN